MSRVLNSIDIVIPIYNAFEDVVRCVDSVRRHTPTDCRIVLIDDCSTDERIAAWFTALEAEGDSRIVLLKNVSNMGFVGTANRGMSLSRHDVVLLNSDTLVTSRWLAKLRCCADSDPLIGTITPFSNNAEICSFPLFCQNNSLEGVDIELVNRAMEASAVPDYPEIPTAVGFCMYIRRQLLDAIGLFDAETFGLGYGEENDFCMRAIQAGYRNVLCDDTFIAHVGSRSFDSKTEELKKRNLQLLLEKHPQYLTLVRHFIAADPIAPIRERAQAELAKKAPQGKRVVSVTVAYNPDPRRLANQLAALQHQVEEIIIVDNGSVPSVKNIYTQPEIVALIGNEPRINLVVLPQNQGIASGFNIGIDAARQSGAEFVLLLDHDSIPAADMVSKLLDGFNPAINTDAAKTAVAAVGACIVDSRDKKDYPFIRFGWFRHQHIRCMDNSKKRVACDFLISSGSLVSISAFDKIGLFDEGLFIDNVDLEWCCRAKREKFSLYGVCEAELDHRLGDHRRRLWGCIDLVVHSPLRIYYMTRNRIRLYQRSYIPLKWKIKDMGRMIVKFLALMLFVSPRREYLRMTRLALRHGLANRQGPLQSADNINELPDFSS